MRCKHAVCYNTTQCCLIYIWLIVVITGTSTQSSNTSIEQNYSDKHQNRIESKTIGTNYVNQSIETISAMTMASNRGRSRAKRSIVQLAGMIRCVSGCDPFSYKSYGCYCGYLGAGTPVDLIDRCCLQHDWCYTYASCPQILVYFVPYQWSCITPGYARCGVVPFGGIKEKCSYQLCQCDRAFAKCLSQNPCPIEKPICQSSPIIAIQNIIVG